MHMASKKKIKLKRKSTRLTTDMADMKMGTREHSQ